MALLSAIAKRVLGITLSKPSNLTYQSARCGTLTTGTENSLKEQNLTEDCDDDSPVPDMDNPYQKERKLCLLCKMSITPDYKNTKLLSQFVSMYTGKIYGRHITGLCKRRQEQVEGEIKKAQSVGLMPFYLKDPAYMQDPELFNPDTPFRNHPY